jgi:hypothetical protein
LTHSIAVYTAVYGKYDDLSPQPEIEGVDYVCFTDNSSLRKDPWRVIVRRPRYEHPRLSAKYFKMLPHRVLGGYRYTVWIDGNVMIRDSGFPKAFLSQAENTGFALFLHPDRSCIYDEAEYSTRMPKYQGQRVMEQVRYYESRGYPRNNGLYAGGLVARDSSRRKVRRLCRHWLRENLRWTYQDQLSLPYLFWKEDFSPSVFPYNLWENHWFEVLGHNSEL